ncbi:hypothetical protein, partial [Streptomyces beihaiensis]
RAARTRAPDLVLLVVALALAAVAWRLPWIGDLGQHVAVVDRLRHHLVDPGSPLVDRPGSSPYYTPYTVGAALFARLTGLGTFRVLALAGAADAFVLVGGVRALVRAFTARRWAPVLAVVFLLVLWGRRLLVWSGTPSLVSLGVAISYPSTLALGLGLHLWALLARRRASFPRWALIGVVAALVVLVNPVTAVGVGAGAAALTVAGRRPTRRDVACWAAGAAVCAALLACWPYYSVVSLAGASQLDFFHVRQYWHPLSTYGLALLGLPALALRLRRTRRDPLALVLAAETCVVGYGWVSGHYTWGRAIPFAVLALQCALAVEVCERWASGAAARLACAVVAAATFLGAWTQSSAVLYLVPRRLVPGVLLDHMQRRTLWHGYPWAEPYLRYGDVVLTDRYRPLHILPAYGVYTVSPAWPQPEIPHAEAVRRRDDSRAAADPATAPAERARLLCRWHVDWLYLEPDQPVPAPYRATAYGPRGAKLVRVADGAGACGTAGPRRTTRRGDGQ